MSPQGVIRGPEFQFFQTIRNFVPSNNPFLKPRLHRQHFGVLVGWGTVIFGLGTDNLHSVNGADVS